VGSRHAAECADGSTDAHLGEGEVEQLVRRDLGVLGDVAIASVPGGLVATDAVDDHPNDA
jgi:hypothetical protein